MSDDLLCSLLRPSDSVKCRLDVHLAAENLSKNKTGIRRSIALLTHQTDLGSLLVLSHSTSNGLVTVLDALPVTKNLVLQVAQTRLINTHATDPNVPTEMWSWLLTIERDAQATRPLECIVRMCDTHKLQSLTAECRRLKEIATARQLTDPDFSWVDAYLLDPLSRRLDLRLRRQPLHTRLSQAMAGVEGDDVSDISVVQHDWMEQVAVKEASNGNVRRLKIRLGTFNVGGKTPSQDLYPWLRGTRSYGQVKTDWISPLKLSPFEVPSDPFDHELRENDSGDTAGEQAFGEPDMLVLGFQELDLSAEALLYATSTLREDEWLAAIFAGLGEKGVLYEKLTSKQLVGMLIIVIVKKAVVPCITNVRTCDAGSGIMGFMGNKGATAVRLEFTPKDPQIASCRSTVLTFVNAHLAAADEMLDRRNYDFQELSGRLTFARQALNEGYPLTSSTEDIYNIYQSDMLFWMVRPPFTECDDLNYRIDLPDGDIRKLLSSHASGIDSIQTLLLHDQLKEAIRDNKAFAGFMEHHITHFPSYRLALNAPKDQLGYNIKRKPAWTDRILYMATPGMSVACVAYRSHPEITMSDHKPVSANFNISLPLIDQSRYETLVSILWRELAGHEHSELKPRIKIQPTSVEFGAIRYKQAIRREAVIRNDGEIPCMFRFVGTGANSEHISPQWLRIEPIVGFLRPRETTTIILSALVNNESAAELNLGPSTLKCTLVVHTALGKDDFLTVSGDYQYTCFANTLERLTRLGGPIRKLKSPEETIPAEQAANAPREVMRLINWLMMHASATDAFWGYPAEERLCHVVRECLDSGDEFPSEGADEDQRALIAAFASTLISLFDSLTEPVVPAHLHAECLRARDRDEAFEVLNAFPHASNINVWIMLTAFLHYIAQQRDTDSTGPSKAHKLASVFAPILLRDDPTGGHPRASPVGKCDFLLLFIE